MRGVASVLGIIGADILVASDVPIGAGLGSSAALEVGVGYALLDLANGPAPGADGRASVDLTALALACQRAEHEYAGTRCGVMDQMIACHGRDGHAVMIDTRTLQCRWLPLPARLRVVVCNTMVTAPARGRRIQRPAGRLRSRGSRAGQAISRNPRAARRQPGATRRRARTQSPIGSSGAAVTSIGENTRVEQAAGALVEGDLASFGSLMGESHTSLRDDFEVSCAELDTMVAIATGMAGVHGARMTGGGFGGCAVVLVDAAAAGTVAREIARCYESETKTRPDIWICSAGPGVQQLSTLNSEGSGES